MTTETRSKKAKKHPKLYNILGGTSELGESELPTFRQCLQYELLIEERSVGKERLRKRFENVAEKVISIWKSANPLIPINNTKSVLDKLISERNNALSCAKPTIKKSVLSGFKERLDKLFDICKCRCLIKDCGESECNCCEFEAHYVCTCERKCKIPSVEL
jgi:hypothetical protein